MRDVFVASLTAGLIAVSVTSYAADSTQGKGGASGIGGSGAPGGRGGAGAGNSGGDGLSNGMPGCGGGTDPSPDGKFYIPGTKRECSPGKEDRKKLR